jgi:hypothetical protein
MAANFGRRFEELLKQAETIDVSKVTRRNELLGSGTFVDQTALLNWQVKTRHLISAVCGPDSQHFTLFLEAEKATMGTTNYQILKKNECRFTCS